jgi:hypothetical protein
VGGKSEIRVSLEDEPGAVSGSKWPQAETHRACRWQGAVAVFPLSNRKALARSKRHQLSSFVWGSQKAQKITKGCTCQAGGYQMIMLVHLENRSNHSGRHRH